LGLVSGNPDAQAAAMQFLEAGDGVGVEVAGLKDVGDSGGAALAACRFDIEARAHDFEDAAVVVSTLHRRADRRKQHVFRNSQPVRPQPPQAALVDQCFSDVEYYRCDHECRLYATIELMLFESDKVMFEIYRETEYTGKYRVVYFTELQDHNKETEINHAMAGEHFFDGFIKNFRKDEAKEIINSVLTRLNNGEHVAAEEVE